ncbi:hypothetical protein V6R21_09270 [Limibacter armeniacum]|uniref:hypothetical protein n=1 Tax=Limibacter armeniacum TaxID=466084 RepID=UPI002FE66491
MNQSQLKAHFSKYLQPWLKSILTGFFMFFVLFIYKGYNIQQGFSFSGHSLLFRSIAFGLLTSLSFAFHEFYIAPRLHLSNWKQQLIWLVWEIFFGANAIFLLFNYFWNWQEFYWNGYFLMLMEFTFVMIFPLLISWALTKNLKGFEIKTITGSPTSNMLFFESDNNKQQLSIKPENLLYLKSEDNYVAIYFISNQKLQHELFRNSLKNIEAIYPTPLPSTMSQKLHDKPSANSSCTLFK